MSAVWAAARAAIRRRRLQTFVIGLVALLCTATVVVSLALLDATSAPFDRVFGQQRGAHAVASFDRTVVGDAQLAAATSGVQASAGPFAQAIVQPEGGSGPLLEGPLTLVGRPGPEGDVDRLDLWRGRWATAAGEIVLSSEPEAPGMFEAGPLGSLTSITTTGGLTLQVVGWAHSVSGSADGWVTPGQMATMRPTGTQMLYRFSGDVSSREAVTQRLAGATTGLPGGALVAASPYQALKEKAGETAGVYLPFLGTFGVLGLLVAIIIVANVVSGAVVSGFRHIGVLKSIGFTPRQVVAVYLTMVTTPATAGAVLGTALGVTGAGPLLADTFRGLGYGQDSAVRPWVWLAGLLGVPALVLLVALLPALRGGRLSAAEAISAGSAPRRGRGLRVQRALSGTRLPRPVSLGLGLPFARPARTALTMASLLLGVATVTFATGLSDTVLRVSALGSETGGDVGVRPMNPDFGREPSTRTDREVEALLRGLPGTERIGVAVGRSYASPGQSEPIRIDFVRGDVAVMGHERQLLEGRWMAAPNEVVAPVEMVNKRGLAVGDTLPLERDGDRLSVTIVGVTLMGLPGSGDDALFAPWRDLPGTVASDYYYQVGLVEGTDLPRYMAAIVAADPGLDPWDNTGGDELTPIVTGFSTVLALLLATVAALGVLNTVALNVLDRRRDLGMLKSIGMTPRQVITMLVTSMAALGVAGGLLGIPLGMSAHRLVVPLAADAAKITLPDQVLRVWDPATLTLMVTAGVLIAVLGALLPARSAARLSIARVLHNE
ncbi:FtsX-like permease family protein [Actinoplanes sp. CA-252034]|uniref:ABC transporter permease n=1 Tax=Actinoplanes sp. CA-252034 TaxID=3239906 RepID=UPI003D99A9CC